MKQIKLTEEKFDEYIEDTQNTIREKILIKGKEYRRNGDVFHNFNVGARKENITPMQALKGMVLKHEVSVDDMIQDVIEGKIPTKETIHEKFDDILVYTHILKTMMLAVNEQQNIEIL